MSIFLKRPFDEDLLKHVSENTGLPQDLLGHNPDIFMNYEQHSSYDIPNLEKAVKLFEKYANERKPIYIYCDYDVDGMGAASIMKMLADSLRISVEIYVPDRFADGYGLTEDFVVNHPDGDALLLTFDNGIATNEQIALAKQKGWMVGVLDHHLARLNARGEVELPDADVIVDPHITGGTCEEYCGAGLAYKFAQRCYEDTKLTPDKKEILLNMMCTQAAISTVADSVPLVTENYQIVEKGLNLLSEGKCSAGLRLLADKFNLSGNEITVTDINFGLVAALNAWGRLEGDGSRNVVKCLTYNGPYNSEIAKLRDDIVLKNEERKSLTDEAITRAKALVIETQQEQNNIIIVYDPECRHGLCGLAAGRLCNEFGVPVIYLTDADKETGLIAGSGRSCGDINLKEVLDRSAIYLEGYGGHAAACGVSLTLDKLEDFIRTANEIVPAPVRDDRIMCDMVKSINDAPELYKDLGQFMWGVGNPYPAILFENIECGASRIMGAKGKTIKISSTTTDADLYPKPVPIAVMSFSGAEDYEAMGSPQKISVLGSISDNVWKGNHSLQIIADYFEPSSETIVRDAEMELNADIDVDDDLEP